MLLQPFFAAVIILHRPMWTIVPALAAVVLVFLIREPLIVLARQRFIWKTPHPETPLAVRYVFIELGLAAAAGAALWIVWPWWLLAMLGVLAAMFTRLAVDMTIRNRQRAVWFQALSAAGLASSGLVACLAIAAGIPRWGWWLWALHAAYFLAAIQVVHARLDARIAARKGATVAIARETLWTQAAFAAAGIALIATGHRWYGAAALFATLVHAFNLRTLSAQKALALPMKTVGLRAMAFSIVFTLLVVAGSL